jgi:transcriptional regulator with XRE-family HTH domain
MGGARDSEFMIAFGNRIKRLRSEHEMSQYELADKANIERSQVARIERGTVNASLGTAKLLAIGFGITLSELVDFD